MSNSDVEVIGMLPEELQQMTIYSAGVTTSARQTEPSKAFIRHLAAPEAMTIYKTKGLAL
jgi:molybdate transport system substrate-binding protein